MIILGIDTTSSLGSLAVLEDEKLLSELSWENSSSHTELLPIQLKQLLQSTAISLEKIDLLAVAQGPGSFTGIRVGLAFVKGLTLLNQKPVMGVSSLEALAMTLSSDNTDILCPVLDARREQVFGAAYFLSKEMDILLKEAAYDPQDYFKMIDEISAEKKCLPYFCGSGVQVYQEVLNKIFGTKPFKKEEKINFPLAEMLAKRAYHLSQKVGLRLKSQDLSPHYLRGAAVESLP